MHIIFPLVVFFLNTSPALQQDTLYEQNNMVNIYLVKQNWHTGLVCRLDDLIQDIPELNDFKEFEYVDIGWGDEEFYQHNGFDAGLAVKALFYPTPSALRIYGFNIDIEKYIELSDMAIVLQIEKSSLTIVASHISATFFKGEDGKTVVLSSRYAGHTRFYKAEGNYHLFNTCNTWLAKGLNEGGVEIEDNIILAEQLFKEAAEKGVVLKAKEDQDVE